MKNQNLSSLKFYSTIFELRKIIAETETEKRKMYNARSMSSNTFVHKHQTLFRTLVFQY